MSAIKKTFGRKCVWLFLVTAAFSLCFFWYSSPLFKQAGLDAAFFQTVGQGMTRGMLPYRDFFDMKGPYLFLIEYLGQLIAYGRWGTFIIEFASLYISLFIADSIHMLAGKTMGALKRIALLIPYLWIAAVTFEGGNLTEEFCLPFLLGCFYLCLKYISGIGNEAKHKPLYAAWYGFSFGFIALIRITNAVSIAAIVLTVLVILIKNRAWKNLLANAISFIAGMAISVVPACAYCTANGILEDMLYCVFVFGYKYAGDGGFIVPFNLIRRIYLYVQAFIPVILVFACRTPKNIKKPLIGLAIANLVMLTLMFMVGNNFKHYYMLALPAMTAGFFALLKDESVKGGERFKLQPKRFKLAVIAAVLILCMAGPWVVKAAKQGVNMLADRNPGKNAMEIAAAIPETDRESVFCYGNHCSEFYTYTGIFPCIKYCDWQEHYTGLVPEIGEEIRRMFAENPPEWLVFKKGSPVSDYMKAIAENQYSLCSENGGYFLFELKTQ